MVKHVQARRVHDVFSLTPIWSSSEGVWTEAEKIDDAGILFCFSRGTRLVMGQTICNVKQVIWMIFISIGVCFVWQQVECCVEILIEYYTECIHWRNRWIQYLRFYIG
jgi:hypothetical protein